MKQKALNALAANARVRWERNRDGRTMQLQAEVIRHAGPQIVIRLLVDGEFWTVGRDHVEEGK